MHGNSARRFLTTQTQLIRLYSSTPSQTFAINFQNLLKSQSTRHSQCRVSATRFLSDEASKRDGDGEKTSESTDASNIARGSQGSYLAEGSKDDDDGSIESMLASMFIFHKCPYLKNSSKLTDALRNSQTSFPEMTLSHMLTHWTSRPQLPLQVGLYNFLVEEHHIKYIQQR